jgi:N-acetylmuramoyl-L-alanine amidase CwlA
MPVPIKQDFLMVGHRVRPGTPINLQSITIHNTGNPTSTPEGERAWLDSPSNTRDASWHYVVGEKIIIQAIPETEQAWHAVSGNATSLGIEVCESGDQKVVYQNAVWFAASLLHKYGWGVDHMKKHQDWTGKYCPRLLIPIWPQFVSDVQKELSSMGTAVNQIKFSLDGDVRTFPGILQDGKSYVAVRDLLEALGWVVGWDEAAGAVTIKPKWVNG